MLVERLQVCYADKTRHELYLTLAAGARHVPIYSRPRCYQEFYQNLYIFDDCGPKTFEVSKAALR